MALPQPGERIGGFIIDGLIGRGAMGAVFRAHQESLNRPVALKLIDRVTLTDQDAIRQILTEARTAARIHHPHLVTIHDVIDEPERGLAGYVMELVSGAPSTHLLHAEGVFDPAMVMRIGMQVATALGAAHHCGLVHRDVQPANVLIASGHDGAMAKLLDLGLARERLRRVDDHAGIRRLVVVGTPGFMAPEQACNPERSVPASDVYALACTMVWWLSGQTAHGGETLIDHVVRSATMVPELDDDLPSELATILRACLDPDPEARPATGAALAIQLEQVNLSRSTRSGSQISSRTIRMIRKQRRR